MASPLPSSPLQPAIQQWTTSELPHLPPLEAQTLRSLTHDRATEHLFQFLTKRVHTHRNTQAIRAHLQLAVSSDNKTKSSELRHQLAMAERNLKQLTQQLQKLSNQNRRRRNRNSASTTEKKTLRDGYDHIFPGTAAMSKRAARKALVDSLIPARLAARQANISLNELQMEQTETQEHPPDGHPHERNDEVSEMIEGLAHMVLEGEGQEEGQGQGHVIKKAEYLQSEVEKTVKRYGAAKLANKFTGDARTATNEIQVLCQDDLEEATGSDPGMEGEEGNGRYESGEAIARDALLRAGATYRMSCAHVEKAKRRLESETQMAVTSADVDVEAEGEKVVLNYVRRVLESGGKVLDIHCMQPKEGKGFLQHQHMEGMAELKSQREASVAVAKQNVHDLKIVGQKLAQRCDELLKDMLEDGRAGQDADGRIRREVSGAAEAGGKRARAVEKSLRGVETWNGSIVKSESESEEDDDDDDDDDGSQGLSADVRRQDLMKWKTECEEKLQKMEQRADVAAANRQSVVARFEDVVAGKVKEGLEVAHTFRERNSVLTQREMRNWATEPGIHKGRQVLSMPSTTP